MQQVETQSKKIILLQEFVHALESHIQALHREIAEIKKIEAMNQAEHQQVVRELGAVMDENERLKKENRQLLDKKLLLQRKLQ